MSSYTTVIVLPHLPGSFTKLVRARETFTFSVPSQKRRNYRRVEKPFGMLSAGAIQFTPKREYSVFDSSQCIVNNGKLTIRRQRESQIGNSLTTTLHVHHTFLYISLPSTARLPMKMHNFMFCEGRKHAMTKFISFMNLDMVDRNSAPEEFACI